MNELAQAFVTTSSAGPSGFWDWAAASLSAGDIISGGGLLTIVVLFYTNRILTIGQHRSRVGDLERFQAAQVEAKDAAYLAMEKAKDDRYAEMKDSRDYWREAHNEQRDGREKAEAGLREFADEYAKLSNHLLGSIEQAAGGTSHV